MNLSKVVRLIKGRSEPTPRPLAPRERKGRCGQWEGREASDRKCSLVTGRMSAPWPRMDASLTGAITVGCEEAPDRHGGGPGPV